VGEMLSSLRTALASNIHQTEFFAFFPDSLKQTVGQEAIQLLVNVDEDDYEVGRVKLLQNKT
jgi:hypothetical protein